MNTQTVNISLPKDLLEAIDNVAKKEARTRSELIREAARSYLKRVTTWERIFELGQRTAQRMNIKSEEDVYSIIRESRRHK